MPPKRWTGLWYTWVATHLLLLTCTAVAGQIVSTTPELLIRWSAAAQRPAQALDSLHAASGLQRVDGLYPSLSPQARPAGRVGAGQADRLQRWSRLRFDGRLSVEQLLQRYAGVQGVEAIQPNFLRRPGNYRTDDPQLDDQWNLDAIGWSLRDPGSAAGVLVAIIDSGVDIEHPDLAPQVWHNTLEATGLRGVDDDANGYIDDVSGWDFTDAPGLPGDGDFIGRDADPEDESGHGTHVAGIVGAVNDNGLGVAGVAPGVSLMVLRAGFNIGSSGYLQDDDIASAIVYAADNGAHVINLSLGDPSYSPLLADAVRYATDLDVVVVAAAGNEGSEEVYYPARLDETLAVAAAGSSGQRVGFSNRGSSIDIMAPGLAVLSTRPGGSYGLLSGTSMAAPHVAAVAALIRARHPEYTRLQVHGAIIASAEDRLASGWDRDTGFGHLRMPSPSASGPLAVSILRPSTDRQFAVGVVDILATVESPLGADYELQWGAGASPLQWNPLSTFALTAGAAQAAAQWLTADLSPGRYTLRARVKDATGRRHEDRILVDLVSAAATVVDLQVHRVLQNDRWRNIVQWETDPASAGFVELHQNGVAVLRMNLDAFDTQKVVTLPVDLPIGQYGVRIATDALSPTSFAPIVDSLRIEPADVRRWDLHHATHIRPDGYVMPDFTDFDLDGEAEAVAMIYGGGTYGATRFFEEASEQAEFTTSRLFIPWEAGDFDLDGLTDLMAVDARRVRILEPAGVGAFPDRVVWEQDDVWGGEVADLDGDAMPELVLRSATGALFRLFESDADDSYRETAVLVNDTPGENDTGARQSVGDLDGDGALEWIAGDSDGDLFAFESVGNDAYRRIWSDRTDVANVDGRLLSAAADLDGDGDQEFISGRLLRDPFDVEGRRWTLSIFGADADNSFAVEWQTQVVAGSSTGNGIAIVDLDGDGQLEWVAALVPHLYVFTTNGEGGYEPVFYTQVRQTQRPATGDFDGNGQQEVVYNRAAGGLESLRWSEPESRLYAPGNWSASPSGLSQVLLSWQHVAGAAAYQIRRDDEPIARISSAEIIQYTYVDSVLESGRSYAYEITAVDSSGSSGHPSPARVVAPGPLPQAVAVERLSARQLSIVFDQPMDQRTTEPFRYRLHPDVSRVESVILDRSGQRVVIALHTDLPDSGGISLQLRGLQSAAGALLAEDTVDVPRMRDTTPARLLEITATGPQSIVVRFDRPVQAAAASVRVDGGGLQVDQIIERLASNELEIQLSARTPLRPLGRGYEVLLSGLTDDLGRIFEARAFVRLAVTELDGIIAYPNPFDPSTQRFSIAGLPIGSKLSIHTVAGERVWSGNVIDDGALVWNGRNAAGERVAAGVYLLLASYDGQTQRTRIAVLPDR